MKDKKEPDIQDLVKSSIAEINYFEHSSTWKDVLVIMEDWEKGLVDDYHNADSMDQVRFTQGVCACIAYIKSLPDAMRNIVELSKEDKNES